MCTGQYEWVLPGFTELTGRKASEPFQVGGYSWRIICFPKQNAEPHEYVSVFLECPEVADKPRHLCPTAAFKLTIKNQKEPKKHFMKDASITFVREQVDWGFGQMLRLEDITVDSGYLRADGAMVIKAELVVGFPLRIAPSAPSLSSDLLSLLESPGVTSDLTLVAGDRSFPVHRTILAARCGYFRTLFGSGFPDSGARELPLPDTNPDALELMLRCLYGDVLACSPELLKPAAELADRWLLTGARDALYEHIGESSNFSTVVGDLLWAEARGAEALVEKLEAVYVECAGEVEAKDIETLADTNPRLLARLLTAVTKSSRSVRQKTG